MTEAARAKKPWLADVAAVALLTAAAVVFWWRAALGLGVFFHYDHALQNFPFRIFFARALRAGYLPLWNSDIFCGFPLFAESQANALYPPFLALFLTLPPALAYNWYHILHLALGGAGAYALARTFGVGRWGAVLAGLAYMFSGPVLYHAHHTNVLVGVAWLPGLLTLMELAIRRPASLFTPAFAACVGLLVLGAQPQYVLYCALVCAFYLAWRLAVMRLDGARWGQVLSRLVVGGAAGLLGGALGAVQVLPLAELVSMSSRGAGWSMPAAVPAVPANLMTLILPHYFGSPGLGSYWGFLGPGIYSEVTMFMGVATLVLGGIGLLTQRSRIATFLAALAGFSFLFSLGPSGGVYYLFAMLPVFNATRFPQRFAFVTALSLAVLAGWGLEAMLRRQQPARLRRAALGSAAFVLVLSVAGLCACAAWAASVKDWLSDVDGLLPFRRIVHRTLATYATQTLPLDVWRLVAVSAGGTALCLWACRGVRRPRLFAVAWCALVAGDLLFAGRDYTTVTDPSLYERPPALVQMLRGMPPGRIFHYRYLDWTVDWRPGDYPYVPGWSRWPGAYARCLDRLPPNGNILWNVPAVNGFSPLQPLALKRLLGQPDNPSTVVDYDLVPTVDLVGGRYVLSPRPQEPPPLKRIGQADGMYLYLNPGAMPRAFIVHRAAVVPSDRDAAALLLSQQVDFRKVVLLSEGRPLRGYGETSSAQEGARVVVDEGDRLVVRARLESPGYLVLADSWHPGWRVRVDGRPGKLLRADVALRAVSLDAGEHEVEFVFRPATFLAGQRLSLGALAVLVAGAIGLIALGRRRSAGRPNPSAGLWADATARRRRFTLCVFLLFVALGIIVRHDRWLGAIERLDPRYFVVSNVVAAGSSLARDGQPYEGYRLVRRAYYWLPESPLVRRRLVEFAYEVVRRLFLAGRPERARAVAAEAVRLAPKEAVLLTPGLLGAVKGLERPPQPAYNKNPKR